MLRVLGLAVGQCRLPMGAGARLGRSPGPDEVLAAPRGGSCSLRPAVAEAVRIAFLGGLGEIGRNCMTVEFGGASC